MEEDVRRMREEMAGMRRGVRIEGSCLGLESWERRVVVIGVECFGLL